MLSGSPSSQAPLWFKSSYSGGNTTECVEAAIVPQGLLIRDSKRSGNSHVEISTEAWQSFVDWHAEQCDLS